MKPTKKLLIVALLAALLTPAVTTNIQKTRHEITFFADGGTQPSQYDNDDTDFIKRPKSIHIVKAI